jgi:hypothetical protein
MNAVSPPPETLGSTDQRHLLVQIQQIVNKNPKPLPKKYCQITISWKSELTDRTTFVFDELDKTVKRG